MNKHIEDLTNFCILPWIHLYAEPDGKVYPCCTATPFDNTPAEFDHGDLKEQTFDEIYHSDQWNRLRKQFLNNERPKICERCWRLEDANGTSYRKYNNETFKKFFNIINNTKEDGSIDKFYFKFLNIRHSTECNFACLTCGPQWSTRWNTYSDSYSIVWNKLDKNTKVPIWDQIKPHLKTVDVIYFTGGEPLLMPEHYRILEYLIDNNITDIELRYNTNMSNLNLKKYNIIDKWKKFRHIELGASIDAFGARAELIRWGTNWQEVENNLIQVKKYKNINLFITQTISILNLDHLPNLHIHLEKTGIVDKNTVISYNLAFTPHEFNIQNMPYEIKNEVDFTLKKFMKEYEFSCLNNEWKRGLPQVINFMYDNEDFDKLSLYRMLTSKYKFWKDRMIREIPLIGKILRYESRKTSKQ